MKNQSNFGLKEDFLSDKSVTKLHMKVKINKKQVDLFEKYIKLHRNVNFIYSIEGEYDFVFELVFNKTYRIYNFIDEIDSKFDILNQTYYFTLEDLKEGQKKSEFTIRYVQN